MCGWTKKFRLVTNEPDFLQALMLNPWCTSRYTLLPLCDATVHVVTQNVRGENRGYCTQQ